VGGRIAMATYGPYAGTKFALEAVSDSLRRELAPRGVQVVVIEPGAVRTEMAGRAIAAAHELASTMTPEQSRRYGGLMHAITAQSASFTKSGVPAEAAAKVIAKAATARKPRTRYTIGREAALLTRLARILPDRTLDRVLTAALRPHFPRRAHEHRSSLPHAAKSALGRWSPCRTHFSATDFADRARVLQRRHSRLLRRGRCRVAAKIDRNRRATLTKPRRVAGACQSALHGPQSG